MIFHGFSGQAGFPMDQAGKGRMALNKHARVQRNFQSVRQLRHAVLFSLSTSIREKDEWYLVLLEEGQGFLGSWEGIGTPEEYSINATSIYQ